MRVPLPPPSVLLDRPGEDCARLGEALQKHAGNVLELTVERTIRSGELVDTTVQHSFERICQSSTLAVASWMMGETLDVVRKAGQDTWQVFGELAAHRAASLNEVTRRCLLWRNVVADVLQDSAIHLGVSPEALTQALNMLQLVGRP